MNHLQEISDAGVSIWLDDLSRDRLQSGSLEKLIADSHVVGVTTNPSIFSAAISGSTLYRDDILSLRKAGKSTSEIVTELTTSDVRQAADLFLPTFLATKEQDGRVSIEVDPQLAYQTSATVERGLYLHSLVNRPNILIKVPATIEGLPAIEELTAQGVSVNVTLIFSVERYEAVMGAYARGLERRLAKGESLKSIHSVASFFVSRIDAQIDAQLDSLSATNADSSKLRGLAAIANAHLAYQAFLEHLRTERWQKLAAAGANVQRPLWASTGVKDKAYDKTRYVVELVAKHVVNTMPEATLDEVRSHGQAHGDTISANFERAHEIFDSLAAAGINFSKIVADLEDDGVSKFEKAWLELLSNVEAVE